MPEVRLSPQAIQAYSDLEKAGAAQLLDAIDDALDILEANPGDPRLASACSPAACGASRSVTGPTTG
jgi:hypothetical protein